MNVSSNSTKPGKENWIHHWHLRLVSIEANEPLVLIDDRSNLRMGCWLL